MPEVRRKYDPEFREGAVRIVREIASHGVVEERVGPSVSATQVTRR